MAYSGTDLPVLNPGESRPVIFTIPLVGEETIVSVSWGITAVGQTDLYAATHLSAGSFSGAVVTNQVSGLQPGCKYIIEATATCSSANIYAIYTHVLCQAPI